MRLSNVYRKFPIFTLLILILGIFFSISFVPKSFWSKLLNGSQFATVFTTTTTGDWNDPATWGVTPEPLSFPTGIGISSLGDIYVLDTNNNRFLILNPDGTASTSHSSLSPLSPDSFDLSEAEIEVSSTTGKIYIPDLGNNRIVVLNPDGTPFESYNGGIFAPMDPRGIALSSSGDIYVADGNNSRVVVLNSNGTASTSYSDLTPLSPNTFGYITSVALDSSGNIYVADQSNSRVVVLSATGTPLDSYSDLTPLSPATFGFSMAGLTISDSGEIYIADTDRIVVLNPDGTASTSYSDLTPLSPSSFQSVYSIAIATSGDLYITDASDNSIVVLSSTGTALTKFTDIIIPGTDFPDSDDNVTINTGTVTLTSNESVHNITLVTGGTLDLASYTLDVSGDWSNTGGSLIGGGTVNLTSTGIQSIIGTNTFENLIKLASTTSSLLFDPNATTTINNSLILNGSAGSLLSIGYIGINNGPYESQFGTPGSGNGELGYPQGIDIDSLGNIYVVDTNNNRVQKFNSAGVYQSQFGTSGLGNGQFNTPTAIAIDSNDNIYVADSFNYRVQKFDSSGVYQSQFGSQGFGNGQFGGMQFSWIAIDSHDDIFVTDQEARRVEKFSSSTGAYISQFGDIGTDNGEFLYPTGIAIDSSDNIYVADEGTGRIQKFNSAYTYQLQFGSIGSDDGQFYYPDGHLTIDSLGNIYVVDQGNNRIQKFSPNGTYLSQFGSLGSGNGEFTTPNDIVIDSSGNIYVTDGNNNRVQKFNPANTIIFNIIGPGASSSVNLSYLSVSNSVNLSTSSFDCTNGCVNGGGNTNWIFPAPVYNPRHRHYASFPNYNMTTSIATSTYATTTATTTPAVVSPYCFDLALAPIKLLLPPPSPYIPVYFNTVITPYIKNIQLFLNGLGYTATTSSTEDGIYATNTVIAVQNFQKSFISSTLPKGLDNGSGYFGYNTRKKANDILRCPTPAAVPLGFCFTRTLPPFNILPSAVVSVLQKNFTQDIKNLQIFLNKLGYNASVTGAETGIYTQQTITALKKFQEDYTSDIFAPQGLSSSTVGFSIGFGLFSLIKANDILGCSFANPTISSSVLFATTQATSTESVVSSTGEIPTQEPLPFGYCFDKNINKYESDLGVISLKLFLAEQGSAFNDSEYESLNSEGATFYGQITADGVTKFQEKYASEILTPLGLTSGTGNFGNATRKKVNDLLGCETVFEKPKETATTTEELIEEEIPEEKEEIIEEVTPEEKEKEEVIPSEEIPNETIPVTELTIAAKQTVEKITEFINSSLVMGLMDSIEQSYDQVLVLVKDSITRLEQILKDTSLSQVAKIIATGALVLGVTSAIGAIIFANPISFSEIWLIPSRLTGLILGALGIRKKNRSWGTVYDSQTKRPLDPVYVTLIDVATNKEMASAITDIDGRYSFLTLPGTYKIIAQKTNYVFPSTRMAGKIFDEIYNDIYLGGEVSITVPGEIITKNIPMDSQNFDWNEFAKTNMNVNTFTKAKDITWAKISKTVFVIGFTISLIALFFAPEPYNIIITGVYIIAYLFNYVVFKPQTSGTLINNMTKLPLSFAVIKVFREGETEPMLKKITDKDGKYFILLPKGVYSIEIDKKNLDGSYIKIYKSESIPFDDGIVNQNLAL